MYSRWPIYVIIPLKEHNFNEETGIVSDKHEIIRRSGHIVEKYTIRNGEINKSPFNIIRKEDISDIEENGSKNIINFVLNLNITPDIKKLNIRTQDGIADTIKHFLKSMLKVPYKFIFADDCETLIKITRSYDYHSVLNHDTDVCIMKYIDNFERASERDKQSLVAYAITVIEKRREIKLEVDDKNQQKFNAMVNLVHTFDEVIAKTEENAIAWKAIRINMDLYVLGLIKLIDSILTMLLDNIIENLAQLDAMSKKKLLASLHNVCHTASKDKDMTV